MVTKRIIFLILLCFSSQLKGKGVLYLSDSISSFLDSIYFKSKFDNIVFYNCNDCANCSGGIHTILNQNKFINLVIANGISSKRIYAMVKQEYKNNVIVINNNEIRNYLATKFIIPKKYSNVINFEPQNRFLNYQSFIEFINSPFILHKLNFNLSGQGINISDSFFYTNLKKVTKYQNFIIYQGDNNQLYQFDKNTNKYSFIDGMNKDTFRKYIYSYPSKSFKSKNPQYNYSYESNEEMYLKGNLKSYTNNSNFEVLNYTIDKNILRMFNLYKFVFQDSNASQGYKWTINYTFAYLELDINTQVFSKIKYIENYDSKRFHANDFEFSVYKEKLFLNINPDFENDVLHLITTWKQQDSILAYDSGKLFEINRSFIHNYSYYSKSDSISQDPEVSIKFKNNFAIQNTKPIWYSIDSNKNTYILGFPYKSKSKLVILGNFQFKEQVYSIILFENNPYLFCINSLNEIHVQKVNTEIFNNCFQISEINGEIISVQKIDDEFRINSLVVISEN